MSKYILAVGNCSFDHGQLQQLLSNASQVTLKAVDSADETLATVDADCQLVLINRVLDRTHESGIDIIKRLHESHPQVPTMLISNYPDAQQQAVEAGALPGFGKSQLRDPAVADRLCELIAGEATS